MQETAFRLIGIVLPLGCLLGSVHAQSPFIRGDVDGDGDLTLTDALTVLGSISERSSLPCPDAGDFDDDGAVTLGDYGFLLEHLIGGEPAPSEPRSTPGSDPTEDPLPCAE